MEQNRPPAKHPADFLRGLLIWAAAMLLGFAGGRVPLRLSAAEKAPAAFGRLMRLQGAASRSFYENLKRTLRKMQQQAEEHHTTAYLVLELSPGPSTFGDVTDVADLLTAKDFPRVQTIAWIPAETSVTGYNALIALACRNIVMHPDAALGDISAGKEVTERLKSTVRDVVRNSNNPKVNEALAEGLADPQVAVYKVIVEKARNVRTTEIVTAEGLQKLRANNAVIPEAPVLLKEAGDRGIFSGRKAHAEDVLVVTTANSFDDLENFYGGIRLRRAAMAGKLKVARIKITGVIDPILESFLERQIDRCERSGINLIIFEITSPGGYLSSTFNLSNRIVGLEAKKIRTVAFIPSQALSGAAILAVSCDEIYMTPGAKLGDAGPIEGRPGQQFERAPEKILSVLRTHMETLGKKKHRPPALLVAMADRNVVVYRVTHPDRSPTYMSDAELNARLGEGWVKGPAVPESRKDNLLTVDGERAVELKLATAVIDGDTPEQQLRNLKSELGLDPDMPLPAMQPTWVDTLVFWLNSKFITVLLLVVAIICIYLELHLGTGLLGILSALCFALFFWSRFLGGTAGWLEVILFLLGLGCLAMEIFVIPGFGVFGVTGGLLILASLVLASQTFGNPEPNRDYKLLAETMGQLAVSLVLVVALAMLLSRYLPHMPLLGRLVLSPPGSPQATVDGPQLPPEVLDENAALVGEEGEAVSVLRPAGKALINGQLYDVISDGPYVPAGSPIKVVSVSGNKVVVRALS